MADCDIPRPNTGIVAGHESNQLFVNRAGFCLEEGVPMQRLLLSGTSRILSKVTSKKPLCAPSASHR